MADALYNVRHNLANLLGDRLVVSTASGATTQGTVLIDSVALIDPDDDWNGAYCYIYEGRGIGQERVVSDYVQSTKVLTLATAWATTPGTDSKYELHRAYSVLQHYNPMIKMAFQSRRKRTLLAKNDETVAMAASTYHYTIPAGFVAINEVWKEDAAGDFCIPIPLRYLDVDRDRHHLLFDKDAEGVKGYIEAGLHLRLYGQKYDTEPASESAEFAINTTPLIWLAKAYLHANEGNDASMNTAIKASEIDQADDETPIWPGSLIVEEG